MTKSLNENQGRKQQEEVNKTIQSMKMEIHTIKERQSEGILELKKLQVGDWEPQIQALPT